MASDSTSPRPPQLETAGVDDSTQTTAQEAVPVRMAFGENPIAAQWITPIYNPFSREAPQGQRGKK